MIEQRSSFAGLMLISTLMWVTMKRTSSRWRFMQMLSTNLKTNFLFFFSTHEWLGVLQMSNFTKEEFVHILRRQSTGFSRGTSKYRGVTLHKCGRWEARMGQFLGKKWETPFLGSHIFTGGFFFPPSSSSKVYYCFVLILVWTWM